MRILGEQEGTYVTSNLGFGAKLKRLYGKNEQQPGGEKRQVLCV